MSMDQSRGALAKQIGIDAKHGDGARKPNDEQHAEQYPRSRPSDRARGDEQRSRNNRCVGDHSQQDPEHRRYLPSWKTLIQIEEFDSLASRATVDIEREDALRHVGPFAQ
jgi:hypothetical protein